MKKEPEISQKTIADELGLNYNTVKYYVTKLKRMNVIEREGSSQKGTGL
jgi:ATP-dependent DNA helicase RecG